MEKTKKFCHLISAFDRQNVRIFWKQSMFLKRHGFEVSILANDAGALETVHDVTIIPSGLSFKSRMKRILRSPKTIFQKAVEIDADIYMIHDPELLSVGIRLKKLGKTIIFDCHEDFPRQILEKDWIPRLIRWPLSKMAELYFHLTLHKYDLVIACTPHIAERLNLFTSKIHWITNYPLLEDLKYHFSWKEYEKRPHQLCYSGTVYQTSQQELICMAIRDKPHIHYKIIGKIDDEYREKLSEFFALPNIRFHDFVLKDELIKTYLSSTIGIVVFNYSPNLGNKLGTLGNNKLFEYMCYGLPVICTDFILWKEIIDKYECGIYVNPNSQEDIRNAITFLTTNREKAYQMGQNAQKAVSSEFNWDKQGEKFVKLVQSLIS